MPSISVIVPVYNSERDLPRCLDSLARQSFTDYEVLCVNDGSTDDSLNILEKRAKSDSRIAIFSQQNKGQSSARNNALLKAQGEYICFIDADDYVDDNYLEVLYATIQQHKADVAMVPTRYITPERCWHDELKCGEYTAFADQIRVQPHGGPCNKIYRAALLKEKHITFPEGLYWEDNLFVVKVCYYCNRLAVTEGTMYNYVINPCGTTRSEEREEKRKKDSIKIASLIMEFVSAKACSKYECSEVSHFCRHFIYPPNVLDAEYYATMKRVLKGSPFLEDMRRVERKKICRSRRKRISHILLRILTLGIKS